MKTRRSYNRHPAWKARMRFFPEHARVTESEVTETWWPWQGLDIHLDRHLVEAPRIHVVLLHGGGGNGRMLAPLGRVLSRAGDVSAVAPDLPGYGLSVVEVDDVRHERWVELVTALVEHERQQTEAPIVLFGLSLGGMLAYHAAAQLELAGAPVAGVIATTLADPRRPDVSAELARYPALGRWGAPAVHAAARVAGRLRIPIRWVAPMHSIANVPALAESIADDPLAGGARVPLHFLASIMAMVPPVEPEAFTTPLLWLHPTADRWTSEACSRPFFERLGGPKQAVMLERCGHFPLESPGVERMEAACRQWLLALVED